MPAIARVAGIEGATFVDVGAGTGRVTRLLLDAGARRVVAFDEAPAMIEVARRNLASVEGSRWSAGVADAGSLPLEDGAVDHAIAGWVFGHQRSWAPDWKTSIAAGLAEMSRVVRPGGAVIVIETLGTGNEEPSPPRPELAEYYAWLETAQGMQRAWVRTDYRFPDSATAIELTSFFFGAELADRVRRSATARLPECTGLWWRRKDA